MIKINLNNTVVRVGTSRGYVIYDFSEFDTDDYYAAGDGWQGALTPAKAREIANALITAADEADGLDSPPDEDEIQEALY